MGSTIIMSRDRLLRIGFRDGHLEGKMDEQHYDNLPNIEEFVASAVQYLLEGDDTEVARLLLNCNVDLEWLRPSMVSDTGIKVVLHGVAPQ